MQLRDNVIDLPPPGHAVLSPNLLEHLQNLRPAHLTAFNQAAHHLHMFYQGLGPSAGKRRNFICRAWSLRNFICSLLLPQATRDLGLSTGHPGHQIAFSVLLLLLLSSLGAAVIREASPGRLSLTVCFLASERTAQILAPGIARIGNKEDPTMQAPAQATAHLRLRSQRRSQQPIILQDQPGYRFPTIPVRTKLEMLCDLYCKKPRLWLRMLILILMSSSYTIDTSVPRL